MTIPYVQHQYYWIPRVWGQNPETGAYASYPAGGWQWISVADPGTPAFYDPAPGLKQRALYVPDWLVPRQVYITGVDVALWSSSGTAQASEITGWIDPGGHFFYSGNPDGAEEGANFVDSRTLFSEMLNSSASGRWKRDFSTPILWDRDAGDLLGIKGGFDVGGMGVFVGLRFMVPNV